MKPMIIDMETITETKAMMKAKFPTIMQYYIEDSDSYIRLIKEALDEENIHKMIAPAHTLKSSSRQMGAFRLSEIAKELELLSREFKGLDKEKERIKEIATSLDDVFGETKESLKNLNN